MWFWGAFEVFGPAFFPPGFGFDPPVCPANEIGNAVFLPYRKDFRKPDQDQKVSKKKS
jgi:hypothetical protein